jgi:integrase
MLGHSWWRRQRTDSQLHGHSFSPVAFDVASCAGSVGMRSTSTQEPSELYIRGSLLTVTRSTRHRRLQVAGGRFRSTTRLYRGFERSGRDRHPSGWRLAAGEAYEDGGYVFADELGRPYHPDFVSDRFEKLLSATTLPRIRLHDTRHTAASIMLASGVPTKVVSELLGHASPTITLAIYAHVLPGMAEEAGAALSASLLG